MLVWIHSSDGQVKAPIIKFTYKFTEFAYASVNHYYEEVSIYIQKRIRLFFTFSVGNDLTGVSFNHLKVSTATLALLDSDYCQVFCLFSLLKWAGPSVCLTH